MSESERGEDSMVTDRFSKHHRLAHLDRRGFTLVEVMVALIVLGVGVLALGQLFITSQRHSDFSRNQSIAVGLAQEIKERVYAEPFEQVKSIFNGVDTDAPGTLNASCSEWAAHVDELLGVPGRGQVTVLDNADDPTIPVGMLAVAVVISWQEGPTVRQLPHTFYYSKVGL